ncbi:MAG: Sua5/YciO/YrdC/YwlC family protein, partial [Chloroflexota bacterium]
MVEAAARDAPTPPLARLRLRLRGAVQGVGFRPFAHQIARRHRLSGFVRNDADGVLVEIEGFQCAAFLDALRDEKPPLATIDSIEIERIDPRGEHGFSIVDSAGGRTRTRIVADATTCDACLDELFEPASRFHLYPFVTCTHCGPRFTIASSLPYDRSQTSMAKFAMCDDCAADYRDPGSRRFHAETIACPTCGPQLDHDSATIVATLRAGKIVAVKGIGGYHLICDAHNEQAVAELRRRKGRDAKPFAVMAANVASIGLFADATEAEIALVSHRARPIVVMKSKGLLAPSIAPHLDRIGLML